MKKKTWMRYSVAVAILLFSIACSQKEVDDYSSGDAEYSALLNALVKQYEAFGDAFTLDWTSYRRTPDEAEKKWYASNKKSTLGKSFGGVQKWSLKKNKLFVQKNLFRFENDETVQLSTEPESTAEDKTSKRRETIIGRLDNKTNTIETFLYNNGASYAVRLMTQVYFPPENQQPKLLQYSFKMEYIPYELNMQKRIRSFINNNCNNFAQYACPGQELEIKSKTDGEKLIVKIIAPLGKLNHSYLIQCDKENLSKLF